MCCWERPGPRPRALLHAALECIAPFGDADDRAGLTRGDKFGHISPDASPSGPLARQRSSQPTQQHTRPHRCEVRRRIQRARTGFEARGLVQTNFAHNFSRSLFETTRKRCNPNDTTSISKQVAGELRAKLGVGSGMWEVTAGYEAGGMEGVWSQRRRACSAWPEFEATRRAKLAARTARGRAAAHRHIQRPGPPAPGTPVAPQATQQPGYAKGAGTEVPAPCRLTQPLPRRGLGRMTVSPGDGVASTGTCRQRRPLPGQLRRSGRRSRCGRGPSSAWWPGRRARRNRSSRR